jgi:Ca-activated chloride channel family protein
MGSASQHFSSGRGVLIAIWFGLSSGVVMWSPPALRGSPFCAQDKASQSGARVLRSEVNLQTVNVQVKDKQGNTLRGLTADDFSVREEGKLQKVAFFDAGSGPVTVAVLVDSSSSMIREGRLGSAPDIAARFMRIARPGDEIWAMDFTEWTGPLERITQQQLTNSGRLAVTGAGGSGSAVYDAIATAICHLRSSSTPRQAIIVITDGVDEHSRLSLDQLIERVRSQRAQLFLIGLPSLPEFRFFEHTQPKVTLVSGHDIDNPDVVFDRLAKEAGAETFIPKSENGLEDALKAVSNLLESEYTLAYYPPKTSHKLRRIEVKVGRHDARVLTSRFLVANPDAAELVDYVEGTCAVSPEFHPYPFDSHVTNTEGETVYRDDFSSRGSGWPQHADSHYVTGGYELVTFEDVADASINAAASGTHGTVAPASAMSPTLERTYRDKVVAAYGPSWHDFRLSADMKAVFARPVASNVRTQFSHPVHSAAGLVFRMNQEGYYALLVSPAAKDKKELAFELVAMMFEGVAFAESVIVPWTSVSGMVPTEAQVAVEDVGDQITIFLDGRQVGVAHDNRFTEGYVGFTVSAPARARFSNLLVEQR